MEQLIDIIYTPGFFVTEMINNVARTENGLIYLLIVEIIIAYIVSRTKMEPKYKYIIYFWLLCLVIMERILNKLDRIQHVSKGVIIGTNYERNVGLLLTYLVILWPFMLGITGILYFKGNELASLISGTPRNNKVVLVMY